MGFSQGTATVCRWVLNGSSRIHRLVLWGGEFPPDTDWDANRQRLNNLDIQLVFGEADPIGKTALLEQQMELLKKNRVDFRLETFNGHHEIDAATLTSLARGLTYERSRGLRVFVAKNQGGIMDVEQILVGRMAVFAYLVSCPRQKKH